MDIKINKEEINKYFKSIFPPIGIFWSSLCLFQKLSGLLSYYSSKRGTLFLGASIVTSCSLLTHQISYYIYKNDLLTINELLYRSSLSVIIFSILERHSFQTIFPSSVITVGAYARRKYFPEWARGSVTAKSATATKSQRLIVNRLGRLHGCHHCGSRQILGWKSFISDHMPPTKIANQMNQVFWRKWLNLKVTQQLWPQCFSCYQKQANAVRIHKHILIYHMTPRIPHLSVLLSIYLSESQELRHQINLFIDSIEEYVNKTRIWLKEFLK